MPPVAGLRAGFSVPVVTVTRVGTAYQVVVQPFQDKPHSLVVRVNGQLLAQGAVTITVIPAAASPPNTVTSGAGLLNPTVAAIARLSVRLFDSFGNALIRGGDSVSAMASRVEGGATIPMPGIDRDSGSYDLSFTTQLSGALPVSFSVDSLVITRAITVSVSRRPPHHSCCCAACFRRDSGTAGHDSRWAAGPLPQ